MPQMAPILWVPLMFSFSIILFLSIIKINFSPTKSPIKSSKIKSFNMHKQMIWTW